MPKENFSLEGKKNPGGKNDYVRNFYDYSTIHTAVTLRKYVKIDQLYYIFKAEAFSRT